jgi:copper chaperone
LGNNKRNNNGFLFLGIDTMKNFLTLLFLVACGIVIVGCEQPVADVPANTSGGSKAVIREGEVNTVSFNVPGMTCEGCAAMVGDALAKAPGVEAYTVDLEHKIANVKINPDKFKADDALQALVAAGYEDSSLKN